LIEKEKKHDYLLVP